MPIDILERIRTLCIIWISVHIRVLVKECLNAVCTIIFSLVDIVLLRVLVKECLNAVCTIIFFLVDIVLLYVLVKECTPFFFSVVLCGYSYVGCTYG
jgi:hypothetical protein